MAFTKTEIKRFAAVAGVGTATGTDTYAVTIPEIIALTTGLHIVVKFTNANTGASTLNVNSLGAINMFKQVTTPLANGDIPAGNIVQLAYDGTNWQTLGGTDLLSVINQRINSAASNYSQSII